MYVQCGSLHMQTVFLFCCQNVLYTLVPVIISESEHKLLEKRVIPNPDSP